MPSLASGAHGVVVSGDKAGNDGYALAGPDGKAFVILANDSNKPAAVVYHRKDAQASWKRIPGSGSHILALQLNVAKTGTLPPLPSQLKVYRTLLSGGDIAVFRLAPDGTITAGVSACRISGKVGNADGPFRPLHLDFAGCDNANGAYTGIAFVDPSSPIATFRVVANNSDTIEDFYVFPD